MSKEFYHRHPRTSSNPWRHSGQPNLLDEKTKKQALDRLFAEHGVQIPQDWPIPKICNAITDLHLLSRIPEDNHAQYKFVRLYAQSGVPKKLLNSQPFARGWNKLVENGIYDPLTEKRKYVTVRI